MKIKAIKKTENYCNKCECGKTTTMEYWASNEEGFYIAVCDCGTIFFTGYEKANPKRVDKKEKEFERENNVK